MFETLSSWQVSIGVVRRPEDGRDLMPLHGSGTPGRGSLAGHRRNCNSRGLPTPRLPSQCAVIGSSMLQASGHSSVYVWMCVCVCVCPRAHACSHLSFFVIATSAITVVAVVVDIVVVLVSTCLHCLRPRMPRHWRSPDYDCAAPRSVHPRRRPKY